MRTAFFVFGVICHAMFLVVFLYMACFVGNLPVPKTIDTPAISTSPGWAALIDVVLLALFAVPHSVMARPAFKQWWTRFVPKPLERSVSVLIANGFMILLLWQWQPINIIIWNVPGSVGRSVMWGIFAAGWLLVPLASLMIHHFDLFGTRQVWLHMREQGYTFLPFRTPLLYKFLRHPLYTGWIIAFWATPTMTLGHLAFAGFLTAYILIAIPIEERDLVKIYGPAYEEYRQRVPALVPRVGSLLTKRDNPSPIEDEASPSPVLERGQG